MSNDKIEKLMRAMGEIDEDLIAEAREVRRPRSHWVRFSALAACLAFLMLCTPILMIVYRAKGDVEVESDSKYSSLADRVNMLENSLNDIELDDEIKSKLDEIRDSVEDASTMGNIEALEKDLADQKAYYEQQLQEQSEYNKELADALGVLKDTIESIAGEIEVEDKVNIDARDTVYSVSTAESVKLAIQKKTEAPIVLSVKVFDVGGVAGEWELTTDGDVGDWVKITVNGEAVKKLPDAPGSYEVTVDLSALLSVSMWRVDESFSLYSEQEFDLQEVD